MKRQAIQSIEFKNVSLRTADGMAIFDSVDFKFPDSGVVWVKAAPGGGKSTLLRILDGLSLVSSGEYLVNGEDVSQMTFDEFAPLRMNMGYSFDFGGLIHNRTLYQNLSLALEYHQLYGAEEIDEKVQEILQGFALDLVSDLRPSAVPGAIRKALCVARAFVHQPQVLLLDDPTTGLRPETKNYFRILLESIKRNRPEALVFIATDDVEFVGPLIDHKIELNRKRFHFSGAEKVAA